MIRAGCFFVADIQNLYFCPLSLSFTPNRKNNVFSLFFVCLSAPKGAAPSLIDRLDKILDNSLDNALDNGGLKTTYFRCFQSLKVKGLTMKGERPNYER